MTIVVCGLSHRTVPLPVLEQLAFPVSTLPKALMQLTDHDPIHEGVILSTCNRTEIYATVRGFHPAVEAARCFLSDVSGVAQERVSEGLYIHHDTAAVRHLFNVASGADSMVIGEPQILGQVRDAFRMATEARTARRMLGALFQRALRVGKRTRTETAIARHVVSLPQAAARMAGELVGGLEGKRVLVVGAGRMGELAGRAAIDGGCSEVMVANRDAERAQLLADTLGGRGAGLEALPRLLSAADVVISVTASVDPVIDRAMLERAVQGGSPAEAQRRRNPAEAQRRRKHPVVVVDLAVPRDVEPAAREVEGVVLRDIDDLREVVERGAEQRRAELPKVEEIVSEEVEDFCAWQRSLHVGPALAELQEWAERVRADEVAKIARSERMTEADRAALDRATRGLVRKLLHRPMTQIRELARGPEGPVFVEAFQEIFDISPEPAEDS